MPCMDTTERKGLIKIPGKEVIIQLVRIRPSMKDVCKFLSKRGGSPTCLDGGERKGFMKK